MATVPGAINMGRSAGHWHGRRPGRRGNLRCQLREGQTEHAGPLHRHSRQSTSLTAWQGCGFKSYYRWVGILELTGGASRYKETGTNLDQDLMRQLRPLRGMCISW